MNGLRGRIVLLLLVVLVLALPFVIRGVAGGSGAADGGAATGSPMSGTPSASGSESWRRTHGPAAVDTLVIMTPHLEAVRRKFGTAFSRWYAQKYHRAVNLEFLSYAGGEIVRYFQASEVAYERTGTYNIDIVWGGSDSMFNDVLKARYLQPANLDPQVMAAAFPRPDIGGVPLYDPDQSNAPRWFGAALSSFGILYNRDLLAYLHLPEPKTWSDLADPRYRGWVELADPTRSASAKTALMVIVERETQTAAREHRSEEEAWARGMGLIRQIAANARGFTATANELPGLVSSGDAAAAMSIDFYARAQIEAVGGVRLGYVEPQGATVVTPEPIAIAQGAPHDQVARRFIEFVLGDVGQRLWMTKAGPGETPEMSLNRLPVMPSVYDDAANSTEMGNPYRTAGAFNTKPSRRAAFGLMDELIALCCIDLLPELRTTRQQIVESPRAAELDARLGMFPVDQAATERGTGIRGRMLKGKPQDWLALQREWRRQFKQEYGELRRAAAEPPGAAR